MRFQPNHLDRHTDAQQMRRVDPNSNNYRATSLAAAAERTARLKLAHFFATKLGEVRTDCGSRVPTVLRVSRCSRSVSNPQRATLRDPKCEEKIKIKPAPVEFKDPQASVNEPNEPRA